MASSIALTTSHTLMNLLSPSIAAPVSVAVMKILSPRLASTFSVRSLSTAIPPTTGSDSNSNSGSGIPLNCSDSVSVSKSNNESNGEVSQLVKRFLIEGPATPYYKVMQDKGAMYARWDMPGIGLKGLNLWVEGNSLHVKGEEKEEKKGFSALAEQCRRKYYGNIDTPHGCYMLGQTVAELKNGVLKVKIPKNDSFGVDVNGIKEAWISLAVVAVIGAVIASPILMDIYL